MDPSKICFILYKPAVPGNIGASARAIKTMGFSELRLIQPADHLSLEAKMLAHGSHEILENAKVYNAFEESVTDIDFIICTTAKLKSAKVDYIPSEALPSLIQEKINLTKKIAIVFGTEESGLPNSIIQQANIGVTISMAGAYPSMNLSQSVMVISYELSKISREEKEENSESQSGETWKQLQDRSSFILNEAGIRSGTPLYHRIIERMSFMKASDARLVHSVTSKVKALLDTKK